MPATVNSCPDESQVRDYLLGKGTPYGLADFEGHLQGCPICEETLRELSASDTFCEQVARAVSDLSRPASQSAESADDIVDVVSDTPFVTRLIDRLQNELAPAEIGGNAGDDRASEIFRSLESTGRSGPPWQIGQYQLDEFLGAGATSVVFRATDVNIGRSVAIKVLRPSLGDGSRQRFLSEARAAASISHPNVVSILHVGHDGELAFMVMPWIPGETLENRLGRVTCLSEEEARSIAAQVASGLQAAHAQGLIHRDIKPANIWLSEENGRAIILDFGLARVVDDDPRMTHSGMLAGTPHYMSPEQSRGQELDGRSDLFSLGCTLYRAVTGKFPFGSSSALATLQAIQHHQPLPPDSVNTHVNKPFSDLVMYLLEKEPMNRPASAATLISAMENVTERPFGRFARPRQSTKKSEPGRKAPVPANRRSRLRTAILTVCAIGFLGGVGYFAAPQIIRIATNQGQLVIETDDPDIRIELLSAGEVVRVIDSRSGNQIDIAAGEYQIRPGNVGETGSFSITPDTIVMTRGGKQVVTVKKAGGGPDPGGAQEGGMANADASPRFDGKTFDEWKQVLLIERNPSVIQQAVLAFAQLANDNPALQRDAIFTITPWVRKYGDNQTRLSGEASDPFYEKPVVWRVLFHQFFSHIEGEQATQFITNELRYGTTQSRRYLSYLCNGSFIYPDRSGKLEEYCNVVDGNLEELVDAMFDTLEQENLGIDDRIAIAIAFSDLFKMLFSNRPPHVFGKAQQFAPLTPAARQLLEREFEARSNKTIRALIANAFLRYEKETDRFVQYFSKPELPAAVRAAQLDLLPRLTPEQGVLCAPELVRLYTDMGSLEIPRGQPVRSLFAEFNSWTSTWPDGEKAKLTNRPGGELYAEDGELITRIRLLIALSKWGKYSSEALAFLDSIPDDEPLLADTARKAAAFIRADDDKLPKSQEQENSDNSITLTFGGKDFSAWLSVLQEDRDPVMIQRSLMALSELAGDDPGRQDQALGELAIYIRKWGGLIQEGSPALPPAVSGDTPVQWAKVFQNCLASFQPERLLRFFRDEIANGNISSLQFLSTAVSSLEVYERHPDLTAQYQDQLLKQVGDLLETAFVRVESGADETETDWLLKICYTAFRSAHSRVESSFIGQERRLHLDETTRRFLVSRYESAKSPTIKVWIGNALLQYADDCSFFVKHLGESGLPSLLAQSQFNLVVSASPEQIRQILPPLLEMLKNESVMKKLNERNDIARALSMRLRADTKIDIPSDSTTDQCLVLLVGKWGAAAESALPWLDEQAKTEPRLKLFAEHAAGEIRKALNQN